MVPLFTPRAEAIGTALRLSIPPILFNTIQSLIQLLPFPAYRGRQVGTRALSSPDLFAPCSPAIWVMGGGRTAPNPSNEVDTFVGDPLPMEIGSAIRYRAAQFPNGYRRWKSRFPARRTSGWQAAVYPVMVYRAVKLDGNLLSRGADALAERLELFGYAFRPQ